MAKKIKILINTDSCILHSGLAETTRHIFVPLTKVFPDKYEIHQIGWFHAGGVNRPGAEQVPWPIYETKIEQTPQGPRILDADKYGQQSFNEIVQRVKPDIVFGYSDLWTFDHLLNSPLRNQYRLCVYYTIDGQPYYGHINEDDSTAWGASLARADELVVLSHFGKRVLKECCKELDNKKIHVRYHGLDMGRYPNFTEKDILEMKKGVLPPAIHDSAFICGWMGRNQFRKQNYKLWELLHYMVYGDYIQCKDCGRVTTKEWNHSARETMDINKLTQYTPKYDYTYCWHCHSKNVVAGKPDPHFHMWFHMSKNDPGYNSDLQERIWKVTKRCIYTTNTDGVIGISKEDIAKLLAMFDVMYYPSGGEGFGNPAFECMASGTPLVFSNYSSHAEFCKFGGLPVRVSYIPELHHGIQRAVVDTNHAVEQMLKVRHNKKFRQQLGAAGKRFAAQYDLIHNITGWDELFTNMMKSPLPIDSNKLYTCTI